MASHSCLPESVWVKRNCVAERLVLEAESITKKSRKHEMNNLSHQAPDEQQSKRSLKLSEQSRAEAITKQHRKKMPQTYAVRQVPLHVSTTSSVAQERQLPPHETLSQACHSLFAFKRAQV